MAVRDLRFDRTNVFRLHTVVLNLPEMNIYNAALSWVFKVRANGAMAADTIWYIDSGRSTVGTV